MTEEPRIIAIETTSQRGGIVLAIGEQVVESRAFAVDRDYAADLLPAVDALCWRAGWRPDAIEQVYVSIGPGSFTGTRIGVTFAKTLALAVRAKVVAVPTFQAISLSALELTPPPGNLVVLIDARQEQVFAEIFRLESDRTGYETVLPGQLVVLSNLLASLPHPVAFAGDGAAVHRQKLLATGGILLPDELSIARAEMVHRVGWQMAQQGRFSEVDALIPIYYRLPTPVERLAAKERTTGNR